MKHDVAPDLFDLLDAYSESLREEPASIYEEVDAASTIIAFLNGFFEQFFRNVLNVRIGEPGDDELQAAERLRASRTLREEVERIVLSFEDFCRLSPDIYGSEYGGYEYVFEEFHLEFMYYLTDDIVRWAGTTGDQALIETATRSRATYEESLE